MLVILHAIKKQCPYVLGRHLKVRIDNDSLKYFLEQLLYLKEKKRVTNMLGYDFEIMYKKGEKWWQMHFQGLSLCYFHYAIELGGRIRDRKRAGLEVMQDNSITRRVP